MVRNEKGITLIEVLAAVVLLGLAVMVFVNISGYTTLANVKSDNKTAALAIAEKVLNEKRTEYSKTVPYITGWTDVVSQSAEGSRTFKVIVQQTDITSPVYDKSKYQSRYVSLQSIVLFKQDAASGALIPRLLTVTVSWEE